MKVSQLMTSQPEVCTTTATLNDAAHVMWENDCGFVPIVDDEQRVVGALTDRDALMAAYTRGARLSELPVAVAMSTEVVSCTTDDTIERAEALMRRHSIRRLPVVDKSKRLIGLLSLNDLATKRAPQLDVAETLSAISAPRQRPRAAE